MRTATQHASAGSLTAEVGGGRCSRVAPGKMCRMALFPAVAVAVAVLLTILRKFLPLNNL